MAKQQPVEMITPPNTLKAKLGGGGGAALDLAAIKRAEDAMGSLKSEFNDWVGEDVARLGAARDNFAEMRSKKTTSDLFRAAHDIKGQAGTFDYPLIARVAASLSTLVEQSRSPQAIPLSLVDAHVSAIRVIFRDKIKDTANATAIALCEELEARTVETLIDES